MGNLPVGGGTDALELNAFIWNFDSASIVDSAPAAGYFRFNNVTPGNATWLYVHATAISLAGLGTEHLLRLGREDTLVLSQRGAVAELVFRVTGTPVFASGYVKVPVARFLTAVGTFNAGAGVLFSAIRRRSGTQFSAPQITVASTSRYGLSLSPEFSMSEEVLLSSDQVATIASLYMNQASSSAFSPSHRKLLHNSGSFNFIFTHEDSGENAYERIRVPGGNDLVLAPGYTAEVWYDDYAERWSITLEQGREAEIADQLTADVNNYAPTGWDTATVVLLTTDGSPYNITGAVAPTSSDRRRRSMFNIDATQNVVLINNSGSSSVGNRFALLGDITILPGGSLELVYDFTNSVWRML